MDVLPYLLLGLLILALIIGGTRLRSRVSREAMGAGAGATGRYAATRRAHTLDELGASLIVHAPEPLAREIVTSVTATQVKVSLRDDGSLGIRFVEPDDTIVALIPDRDGTRLQVETFREYMGHPQTAALWTDLRAAVASVAGVRGVTVEDGELIRYRRGPLLDDRNARWEQDR
ncbi:MULTISPECIES: hypothetical protein [unclassified Microbacterium]|uniref:hypothetical protein n=1 Tax=unclassified Microbacterium TaxID=2609290 RepID=UPI00160546D7|nr:MULTISPECIES: hypothetical protein [unclassified Microbacterium]QNA91724.1 hypothetical protein G4G29_03390 [Microbacterium sp. Se63.02b]QYM64920.1 hypothetical protein K1X59_03375 [Microbacterium sp. Se5.02b]